jgi:signal peptidase II
MILVIIINACYRIKKKLSIIGHIAIIAGVASNYYDRLAYSGVIDFVVISYGRYAWPVFNIADIAIVCGAISMVLWHEE